MIVILGLVLNLVFDVGTFNCVYEHLIVCIGCDLNWVLCSFPVLDFWVSTFLESCLSGFTLNYLYVSVFVDF